MALSDAVPFAVAAWNLDEASGSALDTVGPGNNDLTETGTVSSTTGKIGNARVYSFGNNYHSHADNADLSVAGHVKVMWLAWVYLTSKGDQAAIIDKSDGSDWEYRIRYESGADRFQLVVASGSGFANFTTVQADNFGSPSTSTWYRVVAWHDPDADQIGICVNAGTADTVSYADGINNGTRAFGLGIDSVSATPSHFWAGRLDEVVMLKGYVLDATERSEDYNAGTGVAFADWGAAGGFIDNTTPIVRALLGGSPF